MLHDVVQISSSTLSASSSQTTRSKSQGSSLTASALQTTIDTTEGGYPGNVKRTKRFVDGVLSNPLLVI